MNAVRPVSDLATKRREVVDAARDHPEYIRDTDGEVLVLKRALLDSNTAELLRLHNLRAAAAIELRRDRPNRVALGELAYLADWTRPERDAFLDDLAAVLANPEFDGDPAFAHFFIQRHAPVPPGRRGQPDTATLRALQAALEQRTRA